MYDPPASEALAILADRASFEFEVKFVVDVRVIIASSIPPHIQLALGFCGIKMIK